MPVLAIIRENNSVEGRSVEFGKSDCIIWSVDLECRIWEEFGRIWSVEFGPGLYGTNKGLLRS